MSSIRVFISSTFKDFQDERDMLAKKVFPKLKKICASRGLSLTEVDLRWGVTEEMLMKGQTVLTCLAEVEVCVPFFIGLLGSRYGWHFDESEPNEALKQSLDLAQSRYPWIHEYRNRSITELEILQAMRICPKNDNSRLFFYFRDSKFIDSLPEAERSIYLPENQKAEGDSNFFL